MVDTPLLNVIGETRADQNSAVSRPMKYRVTALAGQVDAFLMFSRRVGQIA